MVLRVLGESGECSVDCEGGLLGFGGPSEGQGNVGLAGWVRGQLWGVLVGLRGAGRFQGRTGWGVRVRCTKDRYVPQGVVSPLPSSSSLTVLASFSASSLSFFSSSRECFSSALAPAPILSPAALCFTTRSLEVSTKTGNELQPPAASSARSRCPPPPPPPSTRCATRTGPRSRGAAFRGAALSTRGLSWAPPINPLQSAAG